jgi:hypothetical protein
VHVCTCDDPRLVFTAALPASADHHTLVHCNDCSLMHSFMQVMMAHTLNLKWDLSPRLCGLLMYA